MGQLTAANLVSHADDLGGSAAEAALTIAQRRLRESGPLIKDRQQGEPDARLDRGVREHARHAVRIAIGFPAHIMMQVVKFADLRVAARQQLAIELRGNGVELLGRDPQRK